MHHYFYLCSAKRYGEPVEASGVFSSRTRITTHKQLDDVRATVARVDGDLLRDIHLKNISYLGSDDEPRTIGPQ